jgi:hypothetical protein
MATITPAVFVAWIKAAHDLRRWIRDARAERRAKAHQERLARLDAEDKRYKETGEL